MKLSMICLKNCHGILKCVDFLKMNLFSIRHININSIIMETPIVKAFVEAGKEYKDFDLEKYKSLYSKLKIEEKKFENVGDLLLHLNHLVCYLLCSKLNDNQKYVLCHHIISISKSIDATNLEMKECFYKKLFLFADCFIYNDDTNIDLIKWLYRIYIDFLVKEKDLNLYTILLQLCTNFFVEEAGELIIDFIMYTMETDKVANSMIQHYKNSQQSLVWDETEYAIANYLYNLAINYIKNLVLFQSMKKWNLEFSKKQLGLAFLLLSSDDEEVWFLTIYYLSVITFVLQDYTICKELFTLYNIDKIFQYINNTDTFIRETLSYLFAQSINNIIFNNSDIINPEMVKLILCELDYTNHKGVLYEMLHFITISFYQTRVETEFATKVVDIVKNIYTNDSYNDIHEKTTIMLLDAIITLLQKQYLCNDGDFFEILYNNGDKYANNVSLCSRYSIIIYQWLLQSYNNGWKFNKTVLKNISILDNCIIPTYMATYIKHVLVCTSLFDKCKLKIQDNCTKYTHDELDLFNFFTNNK